MQSVVSCYCNQLMVDRGSVCGRYYKPVVMVCCCTGTQQCLDERVKPDELVIATSFAITSAVRYHDQFTHTHFPVEKTTSTQLQETQDLIKYNCSSINNSWTFFSSDVSYEDESYKRGQGECLVVDKMVQVTRRKVLSKNDDFVVNCVAVQESYRYD